MVKDIALASKISQLTSVGFFKVDEIICLWATATPQGQRELVSTRRRWRGLDKKLIPVVFLSIDCYLFVYLVVMAKRKTNNYDVFLQIVFDEIVVFGIK